MPLVSFIYMFFILFLLLLHGFPFVFSLSLSLSPLTLSLSIFLFFHGFQCFLVGQNILIGYRPWPHDVFLPLKRLSIGVMGGFTGC